MEKIRDSEAIRAHFPALNQKVNSKNLVYLDNAATAQKPKSVIDLVNIMNSGVNANIHRAVHELSARATELYEESRTHIMRFINAKNREEIIFTSGTTASVNLVASSWSARFLKEGDYILLSQAEHHSNIVPWQMACERTGAKIKVLPVDDKGRWRTDLLDSLLDDGVKFVSVAHISNVAGIVNPVRELTEKAHKRGIPVMLDGAQGIVHTKVDMEELDCDFYAFSGHKLYGPTGTGVLYGKRDLLEKMPPWMGGGDMVSTVSFHETTYAGLPLKFEAGTPNFIGAAAMAESIKFIESLDSEAVARREDEIVEYLNGEFSQMDEVMVCGEGTQDKIPLFSISVKGAHPADLAMIMDKMGIALRSGQMCAEPLMRRFGVDSMLRASFALYNTIEEAQYFIHSLKRAIKMLS